MTRPALPDVALVRVHHDQPTEADPGGATRAALGSLGLAADVEPGRSVAVAVGSRGIADLAPVVAATVAHLRDDLGLVPFVVPAMGSHGGGDAPGQERVLAGYGITEDALGCPVRSQMEVVVLGEATVTGLDRPFPVVIDRLAAAADHVVVVNRVKPHTHMEGPVESGLAKMLLIGLGKREGASAYHRATFDATWPDMVDAALPLLLSQVSVLAAVGIVENAADRTARVAACRGRDVAAEEPALLDHARALLPVLPFDDVDVALIDRIGKDVSGTGWDPNVLGRKHSIHEPGTTAPRVRTVAVRALTEATHGNALGIGLAELCRTRAVEAMDRDATWLNAVTSGDLAAGMLPVHLDTDLELLQACSSRNGLRDLATCRLVWFRSTLEVELLACSGALLDVVGDRSDLEVLTPRRPLPLDAAGNLPDLVPGPDDDVWR